MTGSERLPFRVKALYGVGWIAHILALGGLEQMIYPIFNIEYGISAAVIGLLMGATRFWDAITDPLMGNISDNSENRFGRRKPFILIGAILLGISFALVFWLPAGLSHAFVTAYLAASIVFFYTAYTIFIVPMLALGFEMSDDFSERTSVQAHRMFWTGLAGFLPPWLYRFAQGGAFGGAIEGARAMGILVGLIMIAAGVIPALFVKERVRSATATRNKIGFWAALTASIKNKPFLILISATVAFMTGVSVVVSLGAYVNIYYVYAGDKVAGATMMGMFGTVSAVSAIASIPILNWLARKVGKAATVFIALSSLFLGTALKWVAYDPRWPSMQLYTVAPLIAFSGAGFWMIISSMKADLCDYDELATGLRREGMYGALSGWFQKMAAVGAAAMAGLIITYTMIDPRLGGNQSAESILRLRILFMAPTLFFTAIALIIMPFYPLTHKRMEEIQATLRERRS